MKNIKKFNLFLVIVILLFTASYFDFNLVVKAIDKVENQGGSYRVEEVVEETELGYGVHYQRSIAFSATFEGHYMGQISGSGGGGSIIPGREYQQQVNLLEIANDSSVKLVPFAHLSGGNWHTATVRNAAKQYETENPGYKVVAAVNGDWFAISDPVPASVGVTISDGEYYKTSNDYGTTNTLVIDNNATGKRLTQIWDNEFAPVLAIYDNDGNIIKEFDIDKVNSEPDAGEIALFHAEKTGDYLASVTNKKVYNAYVIDNAYKAISVATYRFYGKGEITGFEESFELSLGDFAVKSNNNEVNELLEKGVTVRCQYEYTNEALKDVENAICFPYQVMVDGKAVYPADTGFHADCKTRKPRTLIGQREDGSIILATIDGRQFSTNMHGMNLMEMGALAEYYGCVDAWKFDGGGSATMIIRKQSGFDISASFNNKDDNEWHVVNSPSDKSERSDGNCLLVVVEAPEAEIEIMDIQDSFVKLNVAIIEEPSKRRELYVMVDGVPYQVVNGEVVCDNLDHSTQYEFFVYEKIGDEYINLMTREVISTALPKPTDIKMVLSIKERSGKKVIQINYIVDDTSAVEKYEFSVGDKKVSATTTLVYANCSSEFYDAITKADINVLVKISSFHKNEVLVFENVEKTYDMAFVMEETRVSTNQMFENIFLPEE